MNKSFLRSKSINTRKIKNKNDIKINSSKVMKILKKFNYKKKIIGGYYPINYEMNILHILKDLENKIYFELNKVN